MLETNHWKQQLEKIIQCPQRQDSITNQLMDLCIIANKFGLYDASDYVKNGIPNKCNIGVDYKNCSSKEYGLNCTTCVNVHFK